MRGDEGSPARLVIADDHVLVREGFRAMLEKEPGLEVVGEAENGREALEMCRRLRPDLILMDVRMPQMDGLEATRLIKAEHPATSILIVTTHASDDYLSEAVKAGASGYILKEATRQQLINSIRRTLNGESPINQELAMQLLQRIATEAQESGNSPLAKKPPKLPEPLTPREVEILRLLAQGLTNRQIAKQLVISPGTVKVHVGHIIAKLGVSDRTQAAVKAIELGIVPQTG